MNHFDADQFRADWVELAARIARLEQRGRWRVHRPAGAGWTVTSPDGFETVRLGFTRTEWRICLNYAFDHARQEKVRP